MDVADVTTRPMGQTEKLFHKMQEYGGANTCAIAELRGRFDAERMTHGLRRLVARHALLRCRVELQDGWPQLLLHTHSELPLTVVPGGESALDAQIAVAAETNYYEQAWLWSLTCIVDRAGVDRFWLVLGMNHSIADGTSLCHTLHNMVRAFSDPAAVSGEQVTRLEPTLESYLQHRVGLGDHFKFWPLQLRKAMFPTDTVKPDGTAEASGRKTRTVFRQFDAAFSQQLRHKAREKGTTVNGALSAAIVFSVARRLDVQRRLRISLETNVSFRKHFNVPNDQAGPLVSILSAIFKLDGSRAFWDLARECKHTLVAAQEKNLHWAANHMWESLQRWMSDAARMKYMNGEKLGRLDTAGISNVGELDLPTELPGLTIENMRFTAAQHGFGYYFAFYVLSLGGKLCLNLAFAEPVVSHASAQAFIASVADLLERAILLDDFSLADAAADGGQAEPVELSAESPLA